MGICNGTSIKDIGKDFIIQKNNDNYNKNIENNNSKNETNKIYNIINPNNINEKKCKGKKKNQEYKQRNNSVNNNDTSNNWQNDNNKFKKYKLQNKTTKNEDDKIKLFGLKNKKFDCYLNSSLQVFFHLENFNEKIKKLQNQRKDKELTNKYLILLKEIDSGITIIDPKDIKSTLSKIEEKYKFGNQQDANEFISIFLNQMKEEVKLMNFENQMDEIIPIKKIEKDAYDKLENKFFTKYNSFLIELFYGRLKKEILCPKDKKPIKVNFQVFNMIELLESANNVIGTLMEYQSEKKINTKIKIKCQDCKIDYEYYFSKTTIYNLPYYLILYLVKPINNFNEYQIEANKICEKNNNEIYELISSIAYYGNYRNGHYFAKCKDIKNNQWYQFSDEKYNKIYNQSIIDNNDIILFYKKK